MSLSFSNKTVLVTGSSSGIGFHIAQRFLASGANVAFNSRDPHHLQSSLSSFSPSSRVAAVPGDVSVPQQAEVVHQSVLNTFGSLDVLVCNVGSGKSVQPGSETYEEWVRMFHQNFFSATNIVNYCLPSLKKTCGVIVCISSICGIECIPGAPLTYSASKAALNSYIRGASRPFGKIGVRINGIAPGNIFFKDSTWDKKQQEDPAFVNQVLANEVPLRKFGSPSDISELCLWLSSPVSSFITGAIYVADGGQTRS